MDRFKQSRDKGVAYLLSQLCHGSAIDDHSNGYYKTLVALQVCGETNAAIRLCQWIRQEGITDQGDFGPRMQPRNDSSYLYPNTWIIIGAHRLGQFDLAQKGMDFVLRFWDPESGGFYSDVTEQTPNTEQDLMVVGFCGIAAIYTGRLDIARAAGKWTRTIMNQQPNFPRQLFTSCSKARGLITEFDQTDELRYVVNADEARDQSFFQVGVAGGFLSLLYQSTGEVEWLKLARKYMTFAEGANDFLFRIIRAGKVGWAAATLYTITGEELYKDMATRIGNNLIDLQFDDGFWSTVGGDKPNIVSTAERVVWMNEIYQSVGKGNP